MLWGDGSPTPRVPLRRRLRRRARAGGRALRRRRAGQPRHRRRDDDPRARARRSPTLTGFEGEIVWDTSMPNGQPRRSLDASRAPRAVRVAGDDCRCATGSSGRSPGTGRGARRMQAPEAAKPGFLPTLSEYGRRAAECDRAAHLRARSPTRSSRWPYSRSRSGSRSSSSRSPCAHNGWIFYQGGDQIWLMTTGWLLGQGELGPPDVGYGWPLLLAPLTWLTGPSFVDAMPLGDRLQRARSRPAAALGALRARKPDRRPRFRPPRRGGLGRAAVRGDTAVAGRLPRALHRAVPARCARTDRPRRLSVDGPAARGLGLSSCARCSSGRHWRRSRAGSSSGSRSG